MNLNNSKNFELKINQIYFFDLILKIILIKFYISDIQLS